MALRALSRSTAALTLPLRPIGRRTFAVVSIQDDDEFASSVAASPKAVAYYTAACVPCGIRRVGKHLSLIPRLQLVRPVPHDCPKDRRDER